MKKNRNKYCYMWMLCPYNDKLSWDVKAYVQKVLVTCYTSAMKVYVHKLNKFYPCEYFFDKEPTEKEINDRIEYWKEIQENPLWSLNEDVKMRMWNDPDTKKMLEQLSEGDY